MIFKDFTKEHLDDATHLFMERQKREKQLVPFLKDILLSEANQTLTDEWNKPDTNGIVAFQGERLVGYLFARTEISKERGRVAIIGYPSYAIAFDQDEELFRTLYSKIADIWVQRGFFEHLILLPAGHQPTIQSWLMLGFAYQQVYSMLELKTKTLKHSDLQNVKVRKANKSDKKLLSEVSSWNSSYLAQAPSWSIILPETIKEINEGYQEVIEDEDIDVWLVFQEKEIVGFQIYSLEEASSVDIITPKRCVQLVAAGSSPTHRGQGIGQFATTYSLTYYKECGFDYCILDYRMMNILASRFWPKQGFEPFMYRFSRRIDERITWAKGEA